MVICLPWDNIDNPWWKACLLHKLGHGKATVGHFPRSCHLFQDLHLSGVCSASFITTVLPVAKAGPSFQAWGEMMMVMVMMMMVVIVVDDIDNNDMVMVMCLAFKYQGQSSARKGMMVVILKMFSLNLNLNVRTSRCPFAFWWTWPASEAGSSMGWFDRTLPQVRAY